MLLLERTDPEALAEWVELEANKLAAHAARSPHLSPEKNLPVSGRSGMTLEKVLKKAEYGHLSTAEVREMRLQNGRGGASRY